MTLLRRTTLLACCTTAVIVVRCVADTLAEGDVLCKTEWSNGQEAVIPRSMVDDGYCDCPFDGADEPHTEACSGATVGGWPGIPASSDDSLTFVCPQQPKLRIPVSRFNDGICDCCDGADETVSGDCPDVCEIVMAEERAARKKLQEDFAAGSTRRQQDLADFQQAVQNTRARVEQLAATQKALTIDLLADDLYQAKRSYFDQRISIAAVVSDSDVVSSIFQPLTDDEIISFIVHACQIAGEMLSSGDEETCVPLRLAGFDVPVVWDPEDFDNPSSVRLHTSQDVNEDAVMDVVVANAMKDDDEDPSWELSSDQRSRRRLEESYDDDDAFDEDYEPDIDDEEYYHPDDDMMDEDREYMRHRHRSASRNAKRANRYSAKYTEKLEEMKKTLFSSTRLPFLDGATDINDKISALLDNDKSPEDDEAADGNAEDATLNIDPAALTMVRNTLKRREERIMRGLKYGLSAELLLRTDAFGDMSDDEKRVLLLSLASGVTYHGNLSSLQAWQIIQTIVPEFMLPLVEAAKEETCASPWAAACPPKSLARQIAPSHLVPPKFMLDVAQSFCNEQVENAAGSVCVSSESSVLPSAAPDGYIGYHEMQPRSDADPLSAAFAPLASLAVQREQIQKLEESLAAMQKKAKDIENEISDLWKEIGGPQQQRMGPNGELYGIRNECFVVESGKYEYELCIFGQAYQRDRGGRSKSGTGLGSWRKMEVNEETGERTFRWEGGAKCWNGPQRSATATVTCGAETRVLSADEPETCMYAMKMESHIACDAVFQKLNEL